MIIIGDELVPYEDISKIKKIDDISNTKANSTVLFNFDKEILTYCFKNSLASAVIVNSLKEAIYANSLNSKYIICQSSLSQKVQDIADNYMFDSRVLCVVDSSDEFEDIALKHIDGVIFKGLL